MVEAPGAQERTTVDINGRNKMRALTLGMAIAFAAAGFLMVSSVGEMGAAEAKAHVTKGKPGKCGSGKYFSKKDKGCIAK